MIQSYPNTQYETEWLDFKAGGKLRDADIPKIWSKAVGAFANNQGGVIVWGVDARKDPNRGIDIACGLDPVTDIKLLEAKLNELLRYTCDPPVSGVRLHSVPLSPSDKVGYVVCFVPESDRRPHRSEDCERRFFLRMGDEAKECSVSILRQLFYPKSMPRFFARISPIVRSPRLPSVSVPPFDQRKDDTKAVVEVSIQNVGSWSVEHLGVEIRCEDAQLYEFSFSNTLDKFQLDQLVGVPEWARILHPRLSAKRRVLAASKRELGDWTITVWARDVSARSAGFSGDGLAQSNHQDFIAGARSYFAELL